MKCCIIQSVASHKKQYQLQQPHDTYAQNDEMIMLSFPISLYFVFSEGRFSDYFYSVIITNNELTPTISYYGSSHLIRLIHLHGFLHDHVLHCQKVGELVATSQIS